MASAAATATTTVDNTTVRAPIKKGARKKLVTHWTLTDNPAEVFVVRFSPDGKLIASGCADGAIRVYNLASGFAHTLNVGAHQLPTTSLRWRPTSAAAKTKNVLLAVNADGSAQHWHVTSGKRLHTINDPENPLFCVDYRSDGAMFATAGKDRAVRVYDEATKSIVSTLSAGIFKTTAGHSNRVFSLKFDPDDSNILVSGGWDNTVQVWDLRAGHSVRSVFGPHICGDSVDVAKGAILTGSYRPEHQLELWDMATCEKKEEVAWQQSGLKGESCSLYAAQFSKDAGASLIAAGGAKANQAKVFDRTNGNALVGTIAGLSQGVFSVDWFQDSLLAVAGADRAVRLFGVETVEGEGSADDWKPLKAAPATAAGAGAGAGASDGKDDDDGADDGKEDDDAAAAAASKKK